MFKVNQQSSPVTNVVLGQYAIHRFNPGPRYHQTRYIITVTKTAASAGFTSATLGDAIGMTLFKVNTKTVRETMATELDAVQTGWGPNFAYVQYDGLANDLITAVADVVAGGNTARTTTFILTYHFAEPWRDSYRARQAYALPTSWSNGKTIQAECWLFVANPGYTTNPVIRAEETIDTVTGAYSKKLASGQPDTTSPIILPMQHWFRQVEVYTGTKLVVRDWPFTGIWSQMSIFSPAGSNDYINTFTLKADGVTKTDVTKDTNDRTNVDYGWNPAGISTLRMDWAADFDDDPTSGFPFNAYNTVELTLLLANAAAANKNLVFLSQVWRDALAS